MHPIGCNPKWQNEHSFVQTIILLSLKDIAILLLLMKSEKVTLALFLKTCLVTPRGVSCKVLNGYCSLLILHVSVLNWQSHFVSNG